MEHDAQGRRPRVRPAQGVQGRRPPRPRLRPDHRPAGRAVESTPPGARHGPPDAALPRTRLVAGPHGEGPPTCRGAEAGPILHLSDQTPAHGRRDDGRPGRGRGRRPAGVPVGPGGRDLEGRAHGHRRRRSLGRRRLALASLQEISLPRVRPEPHQGESLPHRFRRRGAGRRRPAGGRGTQARRGAAGAGGGRLPPLRKSGGGAVQAWQGQAHRPRP